ncbi:MAG: histidinol-phosphate aminotransferase family protein [Armatimonadetes bacterium]|nr:MAG: histidinol-phosphate aminotransferase family protein [Armatimonadota bacterium]
MTAPKYKWQPSSADIAAHYGIPVDRVVRFDQNTSPFSTDWAPAIVVPMARTLNEYPAASYLPLREAAATYLGTTAEHVVPGAGVDEIILLIAKAYLAPGKRASAAVPTYPLYEIATKQHNAEFLGIERIGPKFEFPLESLGEAAETSEVTWLCVPNNPIGDRIDDRWINAIIAAAKGIVVIDAAYAEFTRDRWVSLVNQHPNLIVCHTMSKAFGLAGLRVGFSVSSASIAERLDAVRPPGSISSMSAEIATTALYEPQRMERRVVRLIKERGRLAQGLTKLGLRVVPSSTNFLLCEVGPSAHSLAEQLMADGLVVRTFPTDGLLADFLRFTVRAPHENDRLIDALWRHLP